MNIQSIQSAGMVYGKGNFDIKTGFRPSGIYAPFKTYLNLAPLNHDIFVKNPAKSVNFEGKVQYTSAEFEMKFSKNFFRKLLNEGVPCAYTGVKMIPPTEVAYLDSLDILNGRSSIAVQALKPYKDSMYPTEREIFNYLERKSKKYPKLKMMDLLQMKYDISRKRLAQSEKRILGEIESLARFIPDKEKKQVNEYLNEAKSIIDKQDLANDIFFRRKEFIYGLSELKISNKTIRQKILDIAETLPQSADSVDAFVVKYSQPTKIKYRNGKLVKMDRASEEIGLRLIKPSQGSDEHIYPQKFYRQEELSRQNGDPEAQNLSSYRVTILTSGYINTLKGHVLLDDFIRSCKDYDVKSNIYNHVNRLEEISEKWLAEGKVKDAKRLSDYIFVLKNEFNNRSDIVKIDTTKYEQQTMPKINQAMDEYNLKMSQKRKQALQRRQQIKQKEEQKIKEKSV